MFVKCCVAHKYTQYICSNLSRLKVIIILCTLKITHISTIRLAKTVRNENKD